MDKTFKYPVYRAVECGYQIVATILANKVPAHTGHSLPAELAITYVVQSTLIFYDKNKDNSPVCASP